MAQSTTVYVPIPQGGACELPGKSDSEEFKKLSSSMEVLGIQVSKTNHSKARCTWYRVLLAWNFYDRGKIEPWIIIIVYFSFKMDGIC